MQRRWIALFALLCMLIPSFTSVITNASAEDEIYEAVAALTKKVPDRIQVFYKEGTLHIAAE